VTSALAPEFQKADHYRGESSNKPLAKKARKVFEIKILTSNPQRLNILQPIFANPAPVKAFRGWWGYPNPKRFPKLELRKSRFRDADSKLFFQVIPTARKTIPPKKKTALAGGINHPSEL
jgi:hypothetical protein